MCEWSDRRDVPMGSGKTTLPKELFEDACEIIKNAAKHKRCITYTELMESLKKMEHSKINRQTIGYIVGEVSNVVSERTNPSVYPSSIVIRKDTGKPGIGFWNLEKGTHPPSKNSKTLKDYQDDVFLEKWDCKC